MRHLSLVLCFAAPWAMVGWNSFVSKADEPKAGDRALPGAHRTFADLLEEAEEKEKQNARPRAVQAPAPAPAAGVAVNNLQNLQQLIAERHRTVDACTLFATLREIVKRENELGQLVRSANRAAVSVNQAVAQANILNAPGANLVAPEAKANARRAVDRARGALRQAQDAVAAKERTLRPLYDRVTPHLGPWTRGYNAMAGFLLPQRRDPNRIAVIAALDAAVNARDDFFEGRILAAYGEAYDGNVQACGAHLDKAIAFIEQHAPALYAARVTHDCAVTCVIAGVPEKVKGFAKMIEGLPPGKQSVFQQWLVASHAVALKKEATARTYFNRALAKADAFKSPKAGGAARPLDPTLGGDAVHFFLTQPTVEANLVEKYSNVIVRVEAGAEEWQFARAQAALAASQDRWADAQRFIGKCEADCPATLLDAVREEKAAYAREALWARNPAKKIQAGLAEQDSAEETDAEATALD